jgi:ribonuclease HI
MMPP